MKSVRKKALAASLLQHRPGGDLPDEYIACWWLSWLTMKHPGSCKVFALTQDLPWHLPAMLGMLVITLAWVSVKQAIGRLSLSDLFW